MTDWNRWAQRKISRGQAPTPAAPPVVQTQAQALPLPPPGFGYIYNPQHGYVLVPLSTAPAPTPAAPLRQPQAVTPFSQPGYQSPAHRAVSMSPPPETCTLVKRAADPYADLLQSLPELVPSSGDYDAMKGRPNPIVEQELSSLPEYHDKGNAQNPNTPAVAFPTGRGAPVATTPELKPSN